MFFRVETNNTFDQVGAAVLENRWKRVDLSGSPRMSLFAVALGGDGTYVVEGLHRGDRLRRFEMQLTDPLDAGFKEGYPPLFVLTMWSSP